MKNSQNIPEEAHFHGTTTYIDTGDSDHFKFNTGSFTINFWIYPEAFTRTVFDNNRGDNTKGWSIIEGSTDGNGHYAGQVYFSNGSDNMSSISALPSLSWTMVTIVRTAGSPGQAQIYFNGKPDVSGPFGPITSSSDSLWIGGGFAGPNGLPSTDYDGDLWGVQIWGQALDAVDVANLWYNQVNGMNWP